MWQRLKIPLKNLGITIFLIGNKSFPKTKSKSYSIHTFIGTLCSWPTVEGDYFNTRRRLFYLNFVILIDSLSWLLCIYAWYNWKWYNWKSKSYVVFIVLAKSPATVFTIKVPLILTWEQWDKYCCLLTLFLLGGRGQFDPPCSFFYITQKVLVWGCWNFLTFPTNPKPSF